MTLRLWCGLGAPLLVLLCWWCVGMPHAAAARTEQDQGDQQARLEKLKVDIGRLRQTIREGQSRQSAEQKALRAIDEKIGERTREMRQLDSEIGALRDELATLGAEERSTQEALREQQALLGQQIRAAYAMGREQGLKLLLNAQNPSQLQRMMAYYRYLNNARGEEIERYRATVRHLEELRREILDKNQRLQQTIAGLGRSKQTLELEKIEREKAVAGIARLLQRNQNQLRQMEEDRKQLEQVLLELERAVANLNMARDGTPFQELRNTLPWPTEGQVTREFGSRLADGVASTGIVIATAVNRPVHAVHHGRVVFSDWLRGFGLLIILDHGDGFMSLYGFNQALLKDTGDWVGAGDVVATTGNSGGQRDAGLYFEIRHKGKPDNPLAWLKGNH